MTILVTKRNGSTEHFDTNKLTKAIEGASSRTDSPLKEEPLEELVSGIKDSLMYTMSLSTTSNTLSVDDIHKLVEECLMASGFFDIAREYITYRDRNRTSLFKPRTAYKPFEYPQLNTAVDAIQQSYWVHTEFDYSSDIQDFRVKLLPHQQEAIRRSMLAISQIEVKVKDFWPVSGTVCPKPEIQETCAVFAESEVRHARAYSFLLELLNLNDNFSEITEVPVFKRRLEYINRAMRGAKSDNIEEFIETLLLFTLFIENVSLFSQFLIISTYNKELNVLSGMSNAIAATSLEENVHAMFGADLIQEIRKELPEMFTEEFATKVHTLSLEAYHAERELVAWIFEEGEDEFLTKADIEVYIQSRFNEGLVNCGFEPLFENIDGHPSLEKTAWFDIQMNSTMQTDFFKKRSSTYTKGASPYSKDNLF